MTECVTRMIIINDRPGTYNFYNGAAHFPLNSSVLPGVFTNVFIAKNNNRCLGDQSLSINSLYYVAQKQDGTMYLIKGLTSNQVYAKIHKGESATAYEESDGSVNVYVLEKGVMYKYKATLIEEESSLNISLVTTIQNCDCIYETFNNKIIKHTPNGWVWDTLEY